MPVISVANDKQNQHSVVAMALLRSIWNSPYFLWAILSLPAVGMITKWLGPTASYGGLMHGSGEFSARFLVLSLIITPLMFLSGGKPWARWLLRRRRYIGIAAFGYAALHTIFYLRQEGLTGALGEWADWGILTGWLAFFIFVPLAFTSNNAAVRAMGPSWKTLQRWVYAAAAFTLLHWGLVGHWPSAIVHAVPVLGFTAYRLWRNAKRKSATIDVPAEGVSASAG